MFAQQVVVRFADGTAKEATLTQWSIGQFAQFAQNKGWKVDPQAPGLMAITMLRFQAFVELHRDPKAARPTFDAWDLTVAEVEPVGDAEVDPTPPVPTAG